MPSSNTPTVTPCGFAAVPLEPPDVPLPHLISVERIHAAGVLMLVHLYGSTLHFFEAPQRALQLLDTDQLCLDATADAVLLDRLYCYPESHHRAGPADAARLVAKVFGVPHPDVPQEQRDTLIQGLLRDFFDAVDAACDPCHPRSGPTIAQEQRVESAALAVQTRLSWSMTGLAGLQVRDLQALLTTARGLLCELASHLQVPCRPDGGDPDEWGALDVLVGERLRAEGVDPFLVAQQGRAWRTVLGALTCAAADVRGVAGLCAAVALLRPPRDRCCGSCGAG